MTQCIAERKLLFAEIDSSKRRPLTIRIGKPFLVQPGTVNFQFSEGTAGCEVEFIGLPITEPEVTYGADLLHALQLALDVDSVLMRYRSQFNFYFPDGEPYFED